MPNEGHTRDHKWDTIWSELNVDRWLGQRHLRNKTNVDRYVDMAIITHRIAVRTKMRPPKDIPDWVIAYAIIFRDHQPTYIAKCELDDWGMDKDLQTLKSNRGGQMPPRVPLQLPRDYKTKLQEAYWSVVSKAAPKSVPKGLACPYRDIRAPVQQVAPTIATNGDPKAADVDSQPTPTKAADVPPTTVTVTATVGDPKAADGDPKAADVNSQPTPKAADVAPVTATVGDPKAADGDSKAADVAPTTVDSDPKAADVANSDSSDEWVEWNPWPI